MSHQPNPNFLLFVGSALFGLAGIGLAWFLIGDLWWWLR